MSQATEAEPEEDGVIESVSGPVVTATGLAAKMNDVVRVGNEGLMGEVIEIEGEITTVQVYEETSDVAPGEPVENTGDPLSVDLGPGMLDSIYDGVQRPLDVLEGQMGAFLDRGVDAPGIDLERTWEFTPTVEAGDEVSPGDVVGTVPETESIEHRVMVPPDFDGGTVAGAEAGNFTVDETVVELENGEAVTMHQEWPVREARPADEKQTPTVPLVSGQRILDGLFPIAKGGTAAIPGPFGSGKCVTPDTPVMLADGETLPIEELFHRYADESGSEQAAPDGSGDTATTSRDGKDERLVEAEAEILTFDAETGDIRPGAVSHVYRGSTDRLVRVRTASGRELEVTPAHKLFRLGGDLRIEETPAGTLDEGDALVMPRNLDLHVDSEERVDADFGEFLGLVLGDGMLTEKTVRFQNTDDAVRARFCELTERLFGLDTADTVQRTAETVEIYSTFVSSLLAALGVPESEKSVSASVPDIVSTGSVDVVAAFLRGYYLGNGSISGGTVQIGTSNEDMATGLTYLLSRLGVLYRIGRPESGAARITVTGAEELAKLHAALGREEDHRKIEAVGEYVRKTTGNTNVDVGLGSQPSRTAFDATDGVVADGGSAVTDRVSAVADALEDVFFDPIEEIETVEEERTVYDVTVPGTQNFVGGDVPAVLHNTVTQHQLAKWADADIVVYVGCGERGNEMTEVIEDFPELEDPKTGKPLMSRTCLIANTSNMPVAARESCVYTGITIAEFFRDMGYDVALMADSTSRWAEAMREISSRLEEMPGEEGYPAYLAARLSEFYERAGYFRNVNGTEGTISVIGAVSPPGGDFSEPVTQNTLRIVKTFWALDADLAERRHFPAINWNESYSLYRDQLDPWFVENVAEDWPELRQWAIDTLDEEDELQEIVQLVGEDALPEDQQLTLEVARYLREAFLQQNALHDVDTYCPPEKTYRILEGIKTFNDEASRALEGGVPVEEIKSIDAAPRLNRISTTPDDDADEFVEDVESNIAEQLREKY